MKYEVIVLAAGAGRRMQSSVNKMFLEIDGKPILLHTLDTFLADKNCAHLILVGKEEELGLLKACIPLTEKKISILSGGAERQDSVYEGLRAIQNPEGAVLIHDGARAFVTGSVLQHLAKQLEEHPALLVGVPVKDTIKKVSDGLVEETISRENLWQAQTPQAFHAKIIRDAHEMARREGFYATDDVGLLEKYFPETPIQMVFGSYENIKITTPEDLYIGKAILEKRDANRLDNENV